MQFELRVNDESKMNDLHRHRGPKECVGSVSGEQSGLLCCKTRPALGNLSHNF